MKDSLLVKVQSLGPSENIVAMKFVGTPVDIAEGQLLSKSLTNGADDEVTVLTANMPFAGVAAKSYKATDLAKEPIILVYQGKGTVCKALVTAASQAVVLGDQLIADVSDGAFRALNFAGAVGGIAAIALEAYSNGNAALKKVMLTGQYSACVS